MKNMVLHNSIELNIRGNGQIISNKFNNFFISVTSSLLTKLRNQQNVIHENINTLHNNSSNEPTFDQLIFIDEQE